MTTPPRSRRTPEPTHWYGGYESQSDNVLDVDVTGTVTSLDFWTWHFIEEGWDYGFVEALVDGEWVTVPLVDDSGDRRHDERRPARRTTPRATASPAPRAARTSSTSRSTST